MRPAAVAERWIEDLLRRVGDTIDWVDAAELGDGLSPRLDGVDAAHVRQLSQLTADLPPLVVHRDTKRVVDGAHRLAVAHRLGQRRVPVVYFDGTDDEAFALAVHLNAIHGKALRPRERAAAAQRILGANPHWSDRWIASVCGVAPRTVAALRKCSTLHDQPLGSRIGRDGRRRPLSTLEGRRRAEEIMREEPGTSLRQVALRAGVSVGTALDVRRRILAGAPVLAHDSRGPLDLAGPAGPASAAAGLAEMLSVQGESRLAAARRRLAPPAVRDQLEWLAREPSLRYTDRGRALLRLVSATLAFLDQSGPVAGTVPGHCRRPLDTVVRACAGGWLDFAEQLEDAELQGELRGGEGVPAARAA